MATTDFLELQLLSEGQRSAEASHNQAIEGLDVFLDSSKTCFFEDDFIGRTSLNSAPFIETSSGTGADVDTNVRASEVNHPGIASLTTGTTTAGYASIVSRYASGILLGGGEWRLRVIFLIPTLSDGTDTYTLHVGFGDSQVGGNPTDGAFLRYTHGTNSGKFEAVTRSNSTETATDTGVTVAIDTWYRLDVIVNADASEVEFYLREDDTGDSNLVATNTTNIPSGTGRENAVQASILKSAGTSARLLHIDYAGGRCTFTTQR